MQPYLITATLLLALFGCADREANRPVAAPAATVDRTASTTQSATTNPSHAWAEGKQLFYELISGQSKSTDASQRYWQRAADAQPDAVVPQAYLGATNMMASAHSRWLPTKGQLARTGLKQLDAAVAADPENVEVRFLRGMTSYNLPGFFERGAIAAEDLAFVAGRAKEAVASQQLLPGQGAAALYHHGLLREVAKDRATARQAWQDAIAIAPDSAPAKAARERLNEN